MQGLSVILCTHNGEQRLPATLSHLQEQIPPLCPWEVLLIDNCSIDNTADVVRSFWNHDQVPLRVVCEPRLGLQSARVRGLTEARYDLLGFVDDDNWVANDWVRIATESFARDSSLGALGSICEPVFETAEPNWFKAFHSIYAVVDDEDIAATAGRVRYLHGAGLCVRKQAWKDLISKGFRCLMLDRVGGQLSAGGDIELTTAIHLSGWNIRIEPRLRLRHFMPTQRLDWRYLRKLHRGYECSQVLLDAYSAHNLALGSCPRNRISQAWWYQATRCFLRLARHPSAGLLALLSSGEGRAEVIEVEKLAGRLQGLIRYRQQYGSARRFVQNAPWLA